MMNFQSYWLSAYLSTEKMVALLTVQRFSKSFLLGKCAKENNIHASREIGQINNVA